MKLPGEGFQEVQGKLKEGLEVTISEGELSIYGRVAREAFEKEDAYILNEICSGDYYRVFKINETIDVDKIKATLDQGMLRVTLPKHERAKPREIPIELG